MSMQKPTLYIVDDNKAVCQSLEFLFDSFCNVNVTAYNNPLSFLHEFSNDWHGCLLIDLFMPVMNGIDLLEELKIRKNQLPVIIISGHGGNDAVTKAMQAGACKFITKPFKVEELLEVVKTILNQHST